MLHHVLALMDLLDSPTATGAEAVAYVRRFAPADVTASTDAVRGEGGHTDFLRVVVPGTRGRLAGGSAPTLGIIGRLGGVGARPEAIGLVSDGDGAVAALAAAAKLADMAARGDRLPGDVVVATHVDPDAPTLPHDPVPFMNSVVGIDVMNEHEVSAEMDAIVSIDTTKGNRLLNHRGIAVTPTVKQGYLLRVSEDLLDVLESVTGEPARVLPLTQQDVTPYGNGLHHVNSILQPAVASEAPVVGLAITAATTVAGCATGASHAVDIEAAARFAVETAKGFGAGRVALHDAAEFELLVSLYGENTRFQGLGGTDAARG